MIVKRVESKPQLEIEFQLQKQKVEENKCIGQMNEFIVSLNIEEIENMYTMEEATYFDKVLGVFDKKWNAIPFGEEMMWHFMKFCKTRHDLPPIFFQLIDSQLK